MSLQNRWDNFADIVINKFINPEQGSSLLILGDVETDPGLSSACLASALRAKTEAQLMIYKRITWGEEAKFSPTVEAAIKSSKYILGLHTNFINTEASREALKNGARILATQPWGIEDYLIQGTLDVDLDSMIYNGELTKTLWDSADKCEVKSSIGTNISFNFGNRPTIIGDGMVTKDGEVDYFPGVQVNIAPIEESINGKIVIDASDNVQGVLKDPYSFTIEKGAITNVEGGLEANVMRNWLESRNDPVIYKLCHFTIGLNPKAGISGNMIEDERLLGSVDFGFGSQGKDFQGNVGLSPYHMDIILRSPTVILDGKIMIENNAFNQEMGFKKL